MAVSQGNSIKCFLGSVLRRTKERTQTQRCQVSAITNTGAIQGIKKYPHLSTTPQQHFPRSLGFVRVAACLFCLDGCRKTFSVAMLCLSQKLHSLLVTFYNCYHAVQSSYNCPNLVFSKPDEVRKEKNQHSMQPLRLASLANIIIKRGFSCINLQVYSKSLSISTPKQKRRLEFNLFLPSFLNHHHSGFWCGFGLSAFSFSFFSSQHELRILSYVRSAIKKSSYRNTGFYTRMLENSCLGGLKSLYQAACFQIPK